MAYLKEALLKKKNELETFKNKLDEKIVVPNDFYDKRLRISKTGNRVRYYVSDETDGKERYLKKGEQELAGRVAQAGYDKEFREALQDQLTRVDRLLNNYDENELVNIYVDYNPLRRDLVTPYILDSEAYAKKWQELPYPPYTHEDNSAEFVTEQGELVRSKSEKIIADHYLRRGIPYRYEFPVTLTDRKRQIVIHPDFTVLNKRTRQVFYHEHFGRLDDPDYCDRNVISRIDLYMQNGYFPGSELLFTFESWKKQFDTRSLDKLIDRYLV